MFRSAISRARDARRDDSGFTLIELLLVVIILGILAAVVVFSVRGIDETGKESACKTEVRTVEVAIEAYYAKKDAYPATLAILAADGDDKFLREAPSEYVKEAHYTPANGALSTTC
jgi:prepilin-type N-terminal cleavage/methylation domain-containing protein